MKWTRKVEEKNVELNPENIPRSNSIPHDSDIYIEISLIKFLKKLIPDLEIGDLREVVIFCFVIVFVSTITKRIVEENGSTTLKKTGIDMVELIDMISVNGTSTIIVLFMFAYILSQVIDNESRKRVYILSDDSVISTFYGRNEIDGNKISKIDFEEIEDIEFGEDDVRFVSSHDDIQIKNLPGEEVEDIQNRVMFNQDR